MVRRFSIPGFCVALAVIGCSTTHQTRSVKPTGFLRDYSQLQKGGDGEAQLIYVNPATDFSLYDKIMIDPVTLWREKGSDPSDVPPADLQRLADYLYSSLKVRLGNDYEIVDQPGKGVMRIRAAITEAKGSVVALDIVSTVLPGSRTLSGLKRLATGTHAFVGRAAVEAEIVDSLSGERLMAAVDERAGGKTLEGAKGTWRDVEQAFFLWISRLKARLELARDRGRTWSTDSGVAK